MHILAKDFELDFNVYLITDRKQTKIPLSDAVRLALKGGVKAIQLREKDLPVRDLLELAKEIRSNYPRVRGKAIHKRPGGYCNRSGADGVHFGHQSMPPAVGQDELPVSKLLDWRISPYHRGGEGG